MATATASFTHLKPRDYLLYYHWKTGGFQDGFHIMLRDRPEVSVDDYTKMLKEMAATKRDKHKFVTILDDGKDGLPTFPAWVARLNKVPYVLEYEGELPTISSDDVLVCSEDTSITSALQAHNIYHCIPNVDPDLVTAQHNHVDVWYGLPCKFYMPRFEVYEFAAQVGQVFVATTGNMGFSSVAEDNVPTNVRLLAIPGVTGCACNTLIKHGWHLCDCVADIEETINTIKEARP